jgi:hypothetical protein
VILAAGLLVLIALALFVAGVVTGVTVFYWLCVATCAAAGVFLLLARRKMRAAAGATPAATRPAQPVTTGRPADGSSRPPPAGPVGSPPPEDGPSAGVPAGAPAAGALHAHRGTPPADDHHIPGEPPLEEVEVTDLLLVVDLRDEVLVVDEHPRYHLAGCRSLSERETIPLPIDEARTDGFTPCGICEPDRHLADRERSRRTGRSS